MNRCLGKQTLLLIVVLLLALTGTGIAYALTVHTLPPTKLFPPQGWVTVTQAQFQEGVSENVTISGWPYRKPVTITNSGAALTDYQVKVDVPYSSHMQQDFDDIRFFDSNGNSLSHWRESYTASTSAVFWVKVPSIPTGDSTIYMHYGNESASSASNGTATFVFFDDFESGNLDKWTVITDTFWTIATDQKHSGTYSLKAGATTSSNKYIVATGVDEADLVYDSWWYATATSPDICSQFRASDTYPYNDYHINWEGQWTIAEHVNGTVNGAGWISINPVSGTLPQNTWFKTTIIIKGSPGQMKFLLDDVQINPASGWVDVGTDHTSGTVGHRAWTANNDWWIDDVRARKYADPEPTTTIGAEETLSLCKVELASATSASGTVNVANQTNGGVATASFYRYGYEPSKANDGDKATYWWPAWAPTRPLWLNITFSSNKTINKMVLYWYTYYGADFQLRIWNGTSWVTVANVTGNTATSYTCTFDPVTTNQISYYETEGGYPTLSTWLAEFEAYEAVYYSSGTIASKVYDTGKAGASWDWLGWNGTVEAGVTDITFEVRASDTAFAKDNATLPWQPASALPITGRYQQWRATLTTSDNSMTPVLHEVRVLYS